MLHHNLHQVRERRFRWVPAEQSFSLSRITKKLVNFGRAEVLRVNFHQRLSCFCVDTLFVHAFAFPAQLDAGLLERQCAEFAHSMVFASCDDEILRLVVLKNQPHAFNVVLSVSPVSERVEVAKVKLVLKSLSDAGCVILRVTKVSPRRSLSWLNKMPLTANIP